MNIYVVLRCCGEKYDPDYSSDIEKLFSNKERADQYVEDKRKVLDQLGIHAYGNDSNLHHFCYNEGKINEQAEEGRLIRHTIETTLDGYVTEHGVWYSVEGPYEEAIFLE